MRSVCLTFLICIPLCLLADDWDRGHSLLARGQLEDAYDAYVFIAHSENNPGIQAMAYTYAAYVRFSQNMLNEARSLLRLARVVDPGLELDPSAFAEEFLSFVESVRVSTPIDVRSGLDMARQKFHDGMLDQAAEDLNQMIDQGYGFQEVYKLLGDVYLQKEQFLEAGSYYKKAQNSESFKAQEMMMDPVYRLHRAVEAYENKNYEKALELIPETQQDPEIIKFRMAILSHLKMYDQVMSFLSTHRSFREENKDFSYIYASMLVKMGVMDEAISEYLDLIRNNRFWVEPRLSLARIYWSMDELDLANNYYDQVLMLEPTNSEYLKEFAKLLLISKKYREAREKLAAAYRYAQDPSVVAPWYAYALFMTGQLPEAIEVLETYHRLGHENDFSKELLAISYLKRNDTSRCLTTLESPANPLQKRILAQCHIKKNDRDKAMKLLDGIAGDSPEATQDIAVTLMSTGQFEKGCEVLLDAEPADPSVSNLTRKLHDAITAMKPQSATRR